MKKAVVIAVVLAIVMIVTPAWSQGGPGPGGPDGPGRPAMSCPAAAVMVPQAMMIERMADVLQLTEDQTTKLKNIAAKYEENARLLLQKATDSTKALSDSFYASDYDAQKVKELAAAAEKAESAVISARVDAWSQMRSILTANQVKKLQESISMQHGKQGQRPAGPPPSDEGFPPPPEQN